MQRGWVRGFAAALLCVAAAAQAQDATQVDAQARALLDSLRFRQGEIAVPQAQAHFRLGPQFRYLEQGDARKVLEQLWGNPPDAEVLGLLVPSALPLTDPHSWAVVVTRADDGHVSDEDAAGTDYAELLEDMQQGTEASNAERGKAGYPELHLVGWAEPPRYDEASKKLYWARELAVQGNDAHTLNYDIRALGRSGYLSLNAVAAMDDLPAVRTGMQELLPMVEFDAGQRYADYDAKTDKLAAYGVAALIGGGLAAKSGLLAKLGVLLLGLKKLLIPLALLVAAGLRRITGLFRRKPPEGTVVG